MATYCIVGRGVEQREKRALKQKHQRGEQQGHDGEHAEHRGDGLAHAGFVLHAGIFADEDGAAQRQAGNEAGDDLRHLRACGDGGHALRIAVAPHDKQIHRAVERLQKVGEQKGEGECDERAHDAAACQRI